MDSLPRRVLLIDDNEGDYLLTRELLAASDRLHCDLDWVNSYEDAIAAIGRHRHDVYLVDYRLGARSGLELIREARANECDAPMILLTGWGDRQVDLEAMRAGATDYLVKGGSSGELLERSIRYAIEQHRREQLRARTEEQSELKDRLLSHVSHELRSPLTAIYQFVTLLRDGLAGETTPQQREYLDLTIRNVQELRAMIDDLLVAARGDAARLTVRPRPTSLTELIGDTVDTFRMVAGASGVALSADLPPNLPAVNVDPDRVRQILRHLIDNAIRFTPAGGAVTIRVSVTPEDPGYLCVAVADTGCGLRIEDLGRVFERLPQLPNAITASRKGLGLGLYFCKQLVIRHHGRIWVESEPGRGSVFYFTLPISLPPLPAQAPIPAGVAGHGLRAGG